MAYTDDDLRAFLDGRLDDRRRQAIEADMAADETLERRIMALDDAASDVRAVMSGLPDPLRLPQTAPKHRGWSFAAAACAAGVVIGLAASRLFTPAEASDWRMEVAHYQALYTVETISEIEPAAADVAAQVDRVAAAVGVATPAEALSAIEGLTLTRAQLLGYQGAPLAQIVFRDREGRPIALCLIAAEGERDVDFADRVGLASANWVAGGAGWLLIGDVPEAELRAHTRRVRAALGV